MRVFVRQGSTRVVGAGVVTLALLVGGIGAAVAAPAPSSAVVHAWPETGVGLPTGTGQAAGPDGNTAPPDDELVPGANWLGLPPGVTLDSLDHTVAGGAWTPVEGLLYVVTLGSSSCPLIAEPQAYDTMAGAGLAPDDAVADIDVTLVEIDPYMVCLADWTPATTVVEVPEGQDHGGPVSLRIDGMGKVELLPREEPGEVGPPAWMHFAR